ncbi:VWA domain-containing protein [Bacillus sp. Marseille-P3661]|uniref:VWA domain-containing protein n=1 Tax=Bacillus sp. Marseille-P3661 TaxID=1936234 RepID=UPI000C832C6C|nr:VWA domain-containing protein [Bacillus sp. Marseille-P3661]
MKVNKRLFIIVIFLSIALVACSKNENSESQAESEQRVEETRNEEAVTAVKAIEFPEQPADPKQMVQQEVGKKTSDALAIMNQDNESVTWASLLEEFEVTDLSIEEIFSGLIYMFGMDYQKVHNDLANFSPDYSGFGLSAEEETYKNIAIQLDSSGSMAGHVQGGVKMDLAKNAIKEYTSGLPEDSMISLRVYGHKGTGSDADKTLSCSSTEVMYESNIYDETKLAAALSKFQPSGWTPLAATIKAGYGDLQVNASEQSENILFIVSDGIETCGGNPVEEAKKIANSDLNVKVNIIGFNVDDAGQKQLKETAKAGNGTYFTVNSKIELTNTIYDLLQDARSTTAKNFEKADIGYNVNMHSVEVGEHIRELGKAFAYVAYEEKRILHEAAYQLQVEKQLPETEVEKLRTRINQRYDALIQYKQEVENEVSEKNKRKREEVFKSLNKN